MSSFSFVGAERPPVLMCLPLHGRVPHLSSFIHFSRVFFCREPFIILSGGLSYDTVGRRPCLTIMHGKSTAVLEMDYPIVDFLTLCETPYPNGAFKHFECDRRAFLPGSQKETRAPFWFFFFFLIMSDCEPQCERVSVINMKFPKGKNPISVSLSATRSIKFSFHLFAHNSLSIWIKLLSCFLRWGVNG